MTSPPFGLVRKKDYGNVESHEYVDWFKKFGVEFKRLLKPSGSLVVDIGGAWIPGQPTRSLYHLETCDYALPGGRFCRRFLVEPVQAPKPG